MENPKVYASIGLALQMGCLIAVLAFSALAAGMVIDSVVLGGGRRATLVCIIASIPLSLIIALRVTQILIKRIIPPMPEKPKTAAPGESEYKNLGQ